MRVDRRRMAKQVIDVVFEFGPPHFQFFNLLVGREINIFLNPVNLIVETMILVVKVAEVIVGAFEAPDSFAMFGELPEDWMMKVHGCVELLWLFLILVLLRVIVVAAAKNNQPLGVIVEALAKRSTAGH